MSRATPAWRRKLRFTPLGRWYCALTLGVGLAAINTGNNLLFLVLGLLLSSIVVSGVLSETALRGVRLERHLPATATAGLPALVGLLVRNEKRRAPSVSLELRESGGDVEGRSALLLLAAGESRELSYRFTPARRGRCAFARLEVSTRSPFGLFEKTRPLDAPAELVVFPRRVAALRPTRRAAGGEGERPQDRGGRGLEVYGLREHRERDDARDIHWPSSARAGRPIAVEREEGRRRRLCVVLDQRGLSGAALDGAVEQAAALFEEALQGGAEVGLSLAGFSLPPASGAAHARAALTALALAEPLPEGPAPRVSDRATALVVERAP